MDFESDDDGGELIGTESEVSTSAGGNPVTPDDGREVEGTVAQRQLVKSIIKEVKADKKFHGKAFTRMRRSMQVAMWGSEKSWSEKSYRANIAGRHVKQKTASLYAKNPKVVARRRETLDFAVWDESEQSLMIAYQLTQMAAQSAAAAAAMPPTIDGVTGQPVPVVPQTPPGFEQAQQLIADFQQGMQQRQKMKKFGKTLEIIFSQALREQKPLDFKAAMKQTVRRASTTCVGYVELGFQRETGMNPTTAAKMDDHRQRIAHLQRLAQEAADGDITEFDAEMAELEASIKALQAEPEVVIREGLTMDFLQSTKVIPDRKTKSLVGFVGARRLTIEYAYTKSEVKEIFGKDLGTAYTPYTLDGKRNDSGNTVDDEGDQGDLFKDEGQKSGGDMCCIWKTYDQASGLEYWTCDGHQDFLREPAAPDVFVTDFWPVYALTFNAVESEDELFPPSDVDLLLDMQREYNRSRQGKREHRQAARPRWAYPNGALEDEDIEQLKKAEAFDAVGLNLPEGAKISDVLQAIPVPGVDPNLYDVNEIVGDMQLVVGTQQAQMGATSNSTATESAIAANSSSSADGSSVDDLDTFLSMLARAAGQILMREMSEEQVKRVAGVGAVWDEQQSMTDISEEIYLEVEAGSSGKPNQAVDINNWKQMMPFLIQMPSIPPTWLARESLRRLDDRLDLTEAVVDGIPSIIAQNQMAGQAAAAPPATDEAGQGGKNNAPGQKGSAGSDAPMGDNRTTPGVVKYGTDGKRVSA